MKLVIKVVCCVLFFPIVLIAFLMFYLPEWLLTNKSLGEIHEMWWQ